MSKFIEKYFKMTNNNMNNKENNTGYVSSRSSCNQGCSELLMFNVADTDNMSRSRDRQHWLSHNVTCHVSNLPKMEQYVCLIYII